MSRTGLRSDSREREGRGGKRRRERKSVCLFVWWYVCVRGCVAAWLRGCVLRCVKLTMLRLSVLRLPMLQLPMLRYERACPHAVPPRGFALGTCRLFCPLRPVCQRAQVCVCVCVCVDVDVDVDDSLGNTKMFRTGLRSDSRRREGEGRRTKEKGGERRKLRSEREGR